MRNEIKTNATEVKQTGGWKMFLLVAVGSVADTSLAGNNLELVLDGYAYTINNDVNINLGQQMIVIDDLELNNCLRPGGLAPLDSGNLVLVTNDQDIGLVQFRYFVENRLIYLVSETSDVVCENGIFVDQIFVQGFEPPDLIFNQGFE